MRIIQISNTYAGDTLKSVERHVPEGFLIRTLPENSEEALFEHIQDADYLLASGRVKIGKRVLSYSSKLKMIQRTGVGLDSLDLEAIEAANIPLYVNQGVNAQSVAEHALLLILACLRRIAHADRMIKCGSWEKQGFGIGTHELHAKTVGIIGMGSIGRKLAQLLTGFGVKILYHDIGRIAPEAEQALGCTYQSLETVLREADIISLHCPLTEDTREIICQATLRSMKDGVIIVNTARGGLINEEDVRKAIVEGKVAQLGMDVFAQEPVPANNALARMERVIATPHVGGITYESFNAMMREAFENIARFERGDFEQIERYRYRGTK